MLICLPFLKRICFIAALLFAAVSGMAQPVSSFINITNDLVNNEVTSIIQDKNGFIWFGTRGGLQRYDGYEMKLLKNDLDKGENLLSQSIEVLLPDSRGNIWIGTKSGGLSRFDLKTRKIINYIEAIRHNGEFNADYILSLLEIPGDKILVGTWKGFGFIQSSNGQFQVLNKIWKTFDIKKDSRGGYWVATNSGLRHLNASLINDKTYDFGIPGINITSIVEDPVTGTLWLGTWDRGLIRFERDKNEFRFFTHNDQDPSSLSSNNTYRLLLDSKNNLWVGTWGGGLNRYNRNNESFDRINLSVPGLFTTDDQIILTIMEDPSGLIWVGTDGSGVFKYDLHRKNFSNIGYTNNTSPLLGGTHVLAVYEDPFNKLWVSTKGGFIQYSEDWKTFKKAILPLPAASGLPENSIQGRSFLQEKEALWIGTNRGLIRMKNNRAGIGKPELFIPSSGNANTGRKINVLAKDPDGRIWVGTQENGLSSITGFNSDNTPQFKNYLPDFGRRGALQNERVSCLLLDSRKRLWVGTYKGLHIYEPATDQFRVFYQTADAAHSISNNTILCLAEDKKGNIWAGTQSGLNCIRLTGDSTMTVVRFTAKEGLPSEYIHSVIPDRAGNIWAGTNKGIVRINPVSNSLAVFDKRDGIQSVVFSENAAGTDRLGRFMFGGAEGLTYFYPDSIEISRFAPPVYFTSIRINNLPYEQSSSFKNKPEAEQKAVYETKELVLDYQENILAVEFAALDYHAPDKNEYMYKLEGFNNDWVHAGKNRVLSFTNLRPGTYQLLVKATNSDKIWSSPQQQLTITILPPPWKTWWAYLIYFSVFIFLLWLTRYFGLRQEALKTQLELTRLAREQEKNLAEFKERLFTNISHEFRTPLTLVLGPLEDLLHSKKTETRVEKTLRLIQKQSRRMLRMVNQLLDFQKAEAGCLKLTALPGELVSFCRDIHMLFADEAARRNINYSFESTDKYISFQFDPNKLEIIVFNILSNAFKFTPDGGKIRLQISRSKDGSCIIRITDTGTGIPPAEIDRIFDRFYRGKEQDATNISGTGIGLSFVKELIALHKGSITAESDGVQGSSFTVTLPVLPSHVTVPAIPLLELPAAINQPANSTLNTTAMTEEQENMNPENELPIILVVEDESDMLQYVYEILSPSYQVITAVNGKEGIAKAFEFIPDLVVSDVMMPETDGIELCRTLKSDKRTSHIPIVLLTALSDINHHVQGIKEGADVYLPKPFNSQLLLVHIHNLINTRNTLKDLYAKKVFLGSGSFEIKTFEEEFLYKLVKLVEENISNSNFNNDELAQLMFMSRSTFYRKLKAVTGMSGNEFIRTTRLNYAATLLESGKYSVTEAAYEAGFNDLKYFRKRFQDQFGASPSDYKK